MYSVAVTCETHGGLGQMQGILSFDGQRVVLQYQTADSMLGLLKTDAREIVISLETLVDVRYSSGFCWLFPKVQLRVSDFNSIASLPAVDGGRVTLRVRFSDRQDAQRLVSSVDALASERRFARLNAEINMLSGVDPRRTPAEPVVKPASSAGQAPQQQSE